MAFKRWLMLAAFLTCASCGGSDDESRTPPPTGTEAPASRPSATPSPIATPETAGTLSPVPATAAASGFVFAAAGDHGANADTQASLAHLNQSGAAFYLALGDMDYNQTSSDAAWCEYIKNGLPAPGATFPFQLVAGNHEGTGSPHGDILNHAACLPDRLNSTGVYAAEYYFDYPAQNPLLRAIMIAPNVNVGGVSYEYSQGNTHYSWLSTAIDEARTARIPWVVVGMHKNCITTGAKACEIGEDLLNLLVEEKVDLVLQGHDHNYQRSKQLSLGEGCRALQADSFNAACVVNDGDNAQYTRGSGTAIVISGNFGMPLYPVKPGDPEADYLAVIDATSHGFTKFSVTGDRIEAEFVPSTGDFTDTFTIASD
jgi:hypothetical protein